MERLLVAGIDTVVGANLAANLSDAYHILGFSNTTPVSIEGCESAVLPAHDAHSVHQAAASHRADRIVICGVAGDSGWHKVGGRLATAATIESARTWTQAAIKLGTPLTLISSDAVFTGPWMFHGETSTSLCSSTQARGLRSLESWVREACPAGAGCPHASLRLESRGGQTGWIEGLLAALESDNTAVFDCMPHATPILATDLADILSRAWTASLSGTFHIGGAERVNPDGFARALARMFDLAAPRAAVRRELVSGEQGFGRGETSLRSHVVRRSLGVPLPMLEEGLKRLRDQKDDGFDRRFRGNRPLAASKVA